MTSSADTSSADTSSVGASSSSHAALPDDWEMVVGLEVHAQISSDSKLFSGAATVFNVAPNSQNSQVSFVDAAMPGMLPSLNRRCVDKALLTAIALGGIESVNRYSVFERKNYFYPDLPQGYQISQLKHPLMQGGEITIALDDGSTKKITLERMHMEQDAGKSLHDMIAGKTAIDLNRSGVALMEIVSKPDLASPQEASAYVAKLRAILRAIDTCNGNMQEGSLRVDANVSVRKKDDPNLGTRCEIKNLNSLRFLRQAILCEAQRQVALKEQGERVVQQTRLFDAAQGTTRSMRSKEEAHDYRYFPDPDIPPLVIDEARLVELRVTLPELPDARCARFRQDYGLSASDASLLGEEAASAAYFSTLAKAVPAKTAANWMTTELFARMKARDVEMDAVATRLRLPAERAVTLLLLVEKGTISARAAKTLLDRMLESDQEPTALVEELGLQQIGDEKALLPLLQALLDDNPKQRDAYRGGKQAVFGWFVGQAMQRTKGRGDPKVVNALLRRLLDEKEG